MKIRSVVLREVANRQTDRQTDIQTERQTPGKHNLVGGANKNSATTS